VKRTVLDASALISFYLSRPGAMKVEEVLKAAADGASDLFMSAVNWGEIYYALWRDQGQEIARKVLEQIAQLPIEIVPASREHAALAAEFKARYKLPYADGFAAALAQLHKAELLTADADFGRIKAEVAVVFL